MGEGGTIKYCRVLHPEYTFKYVNRRVNARDNVAQFSKVDDDANGILKTKTRNILLLSMEK